MPAALAANSIETVAAPDEHELIEVVIVNVISQSIVLFVTFVVEKDPEEGLESPYLYWKYTVDPLLTAVVV